MRMIWGNVIRIVTSPDEVTWAADEDHSPRVEEPVIIAEVMDIAAGTAADVAAALVVLPDGFAKQLPLIGSQEVFVSHAII